MRSKAEWGRGATRTRDFPSSGTETQMGHQGKGKRNKGDECLRVWGKMRMQHSEKSTIYRGGVAAASCSIPLLIPYRSDTDASPYSEWAPQKLTGARIGGTRESS